MGKFQVSHRQVLLTLVGAFCICLNTDFYYFDSTANCEHQTQAFLNVTLAIRSGYDWNIIRRIIAVLPPYHMGVCTYVCVCTCNNCIGKSQERNTPKHLISLCDKF